MNRVISIGLAFAVLSTLATAALADETFDLTWTGVRNGASAVGTITMDPTAIPANGPADNSGFFITADPFVSALSVTVSGSGAGDGTFTLADFNTVLFNQNGGALNFGEQLVGQPTSGDPWGSTSGNGGDFNLFNRTSPGQANAPDGSFNFTLTTDAGTGDSMVLTSFLPAQQPAGTPEPGALAILGGFAVSGYMAARRRIRK